MNRHQRRRLRKAAKATKQPELTAELQGVLEKIQEAQAEAGKREQKAQLAARVRQEISKTLEAEYLELDPETTDLLSEKMIQACDRELEARLLLVDSLEDLVEAIDKLDEERTGLILPEKPELELVR